MRTFIAALALLSALAPFQASAKTITLELLEVQTVQISSGIGSAMLSYEPFDPAKGALKRVDVQFSYTALTNLLLQPNFVQSGLVLTPSPYNGVLNVETLFRSSLGGFSSFFAAPAPAVFSSDGFQASGLLATLYNYSFSVESPNPINTVVGPSLKIGSTVTLLDPITTDDFLPLFPAAPDLARMSLLEVSVQSLDPRITPVTTTLNGAMLLTYVYDKTIVIEDPDPEGPTVPVAPTNPPAVVPLPAGAPLLMAGLAVLGCLGVRRPVRTNS